MAVFLIEGFDHLLAGGMTSKAWSANPTSMQAGRFDGQCARITNNSPTNIRKTLPSTYSTIFAGFAVRGSNASTTNNDFFALQVGTTQTCRIGVNGAGLLKVLNSGGTVIATGTTPIGNNAWNYIEVKLVIAGASGTVEVHLNGAVEIASTTGNFGSSNIDTIGLVGAASGSTQNWDYDDIYVLDTSGSAPRNTFLGDVRVETIYPTADGAHAQWTPNSGTNHFDRVDEAQADGDTTYVSDSTPGHYDTYTFGDIDTGATVYGLQTNLYARKDDANTRQIAPVIRQSGTDHDGTTVTLSTSYVNYTQIYNQDVAVSPADWTPTTVNANEYGVKEVA